MKENSTADVFNHLLPIDMYNTYDRCRLHNNTACKVPSDLYSAMIHLLNLMQSIKHIQHNESCFELFDAVSNDKNIVLTQSA